MKKHIVSTIFAISVLPALVGATPLSNTAVVAQIHSIYLYKGDSTLGAHKVLNASMVPSFSKCAVYLPKGSQSSTTKITLSRGSSGRISLTCG